MARHTYRDQRGLPRLEAFLRDVRYGWRGLARSPGFATVAILMLALGIGANTAIFSVVNTVLLRPLAYPDPDRLVQLVLSTSGGRGITLSIPEFMNLRRQTEVFQDIAAYDFGDPGVNLTGGDLPERVKGIHVSTDYFRLFGARVLAGRTFSAEEDLPGGGRLVVISHGLWRRRFNADPGLVGTTISLGGEPHGVIGILGPSFQPDPPADVWLPLQAGPTSRSQAHYLRIAARVKPGVTIDRVNAQLEIATAEFRRDFPLFSEHASFTVWPLRDTGIRDVRKALFILLGAVGLVLLIACANVANLLLVRAAGRQREIAIRIAVGASRGRLVWQSLSESLLLCTAGGLLGLIIGHVGIRALLALYPSNIPRVGADGSAVTLDWRVFAFTFAVAMATGVLFGLFPALSSSRPDLSAQMQEGGSRSSSAVHQNRTRSLFVVAQLALALVLLVGAGLLIQTFAALRAVRPGFDATNVLTLEMSLTGSRFQETAEVMQVVREAERRLQSLPGIAAVASSWMLPVESAFSSVFAIEGRPPAGKQEPNIALMRPVSRGYFDVFHIPLLRGRLFTDRDEAAWDGVVVISDRMAKKFWPDQDPIGERIDIDYHIADFAAPPRRIIGIVGDVRNYRIEREPDPMMYLSQAQAPDGLTATDARIIPITWVVRTETEPFSMSGAIQDELRKASGGLPVSRVRSMDQVVSQSLARSDFNTIVLTVFAATALLLAAIGVYELMSYSVQQRRREIGIRMALGAGPEQVRNEIVLQGMRVSLIGLLLGVAAALGLARFMSSLVYGTTTSNPVVIAGVSLLLFFTVLLASYVPSRRATRINPVEALRHE